MGEEKDYLSVGKITGVHGVKGNIKVLSHSGDPSDFKAGLHLLARCGNGHTYTCTVRWCKPHGRHFLLSFKEIDDRTGAGSLAGCELFALRTDLPALDADTYYWEDILGLAVYDSDRGLLGHVRNIIPTGSNDVYEVVDADTGKDCLIPALQSVIRKIDLEEGVIYVYLPEEL
ncbi:MAG: ribosome maturation factor RimM [Thermodesulfobacteriota bacterium]|nr:ribosome maturation factor RimM [Thermodesulfobacteriota bacterium]